MTCKLTCSRDESFNSITGLNGSGKSNILDAICFVLGITNMSTVRAQNLQACLPVRLSIKITGLGFNLQARAGWRHESQRHNRVR